MDGKLPERKRLYHEVPSGVDPVEAVFFVTICCAERGGDFLVSDSVGTGLVESVRYQNEGGVWWCSAFVVMPDHVHGLIRFGNRDAGVGMREVMKRWKAWTAREFRIRWQRGWFDHRLRSEEREREKAMYVLENPVRAGLVEKWEDWGFWFVGDGE
ncbi:MAG: hypothetical protein AAGC74_13865 [Verrucomicrobiota bacterium]